MADRAELMNACQIGRDAAKQSGISPNPFKPGTLRSVAFECGYDNDLGRWLDLFNGRRVSGRGGRFRSYETVQLTRPGSNPEKADFVRYAGDGLAVIRSARFGNLETISLNWLAHWSVGVSA